MKKNPFPLQLHLLSKAGSPLNADQILENLAFESADMLEYYYGSPRHSKMEALGTTIRSIIRRRDTSSEDKLRSVSSLLRAIPISTERIRNSQIRAFGLPDEQTNEAGLGEMQPLDRIWAAFEDGNGNPSEYHPLYRQSSGRPDAPARTLYHGGNRWDAFEGNRRLNGPSPDPSLAYLGNFYGPTFDASTAASYAAKFAMNPESGQSGSRYVHAISHPEDFNFFDGSHTKEIYPEDFVEKVIQSGALHYTGLSDEEIKYQLYRPSKREISWNGNLDQDDPAQAALLLKPHTGYGMYQRLLQIATNQEKKTSGWSGYFPNAFGSSGEVRQTEAYAHEQGAKVAVNGILGAIGYDGISHPVSEEQRIVQADPLAKDENFPSEGGDSTNFHIFGTSMPRVTSGNLDNRINARAGDAAPQWARARTPQEQGMRVSLPDAAKNDPAYGRLTLVDPPPPARDMPRIAPVDEKEEAMVSPGGRTPIMNSPQPGFTPAPPPFKPPGFDPVKPPEKREGFTPAPPSFNPPGFDAVKPLEKPEGFASRPPSFKLPGFGGTAKTPTGQTVLPGPAMSTLKRSWFSVSIRRSE